ncbi:hypothetical protein AC249_AIPGENE106 [Exaiptasia diaphana]|nr:hypothetical protein AC249_AIPGENE106 [Exaiptasia diaphana]
MADEVECKASSVKVRGTDGNYLKTLLPKDLERYKDKLKITLDGEKLVVNNPYESWDDEKYWNNHPTSWPNIQFGDIWIYLVESPGPFTKERLKCYKSLLAYDYFISRKVGPVFTHEISSKQEEGAIKVLKAEVRPGQAESKNSYLPWIICKKSGEIITAHCDCKAGLGETCSHAASIMFKVETAVKMGLTTDACTSKACRWNAVFGNDSLTAPVDEINFQKAKKGETTPRLEVSSTNRKPLACSSGDYMFMEAYSGFLQELKDICPNACVFKSLPKLDEEETDTACSEDSFQDDESDDESGDEQYTLFIKPNSYNNTSMHPVVPPGPPPFPLTGERLKKWGILPSDLTPHELNYVKALSVDYNEAHKFQCDTQKQIVHCGSNLENPGLLLQSLA